MKLTYPLVAAVASALVINLTIATVGIRLTRVPSTFPPFTFLPILSGCVGGPVLATLVYVILRRVVDHPDRAFLFVAVVMLAVSFSLPLRLSFTRSPRFAGVTPAAQMMLILMHAVVATTTVVSLLVKPQS